MKKKIAILSLIAIFIAATSLSAQTTTKTATSKAKTEVKAEKKADAKCDKSTTKACCKDKKNMTAAEKAKCCKENKACCKNMKAEDKAKCCNGKAVADTKNPKAGAKACDKKAEPKTTIVKK